MPDSHTDLEAGRKFNDAVSATGVVGGIRSDLKSVQEDVTEIKGDVKAIRSTMDRYGGAIMIVGSLVSVAVSLAVGLLK